MKRPLPGFTTQNRPSPTRRGTDLNFSSRQGEVRRTHVKSRLSYHFLLKPGLNGQQPMDTDGKLKSA
jgi:hypothetical protein